LSESGLPEPTSRRVDQWLWFARLTKSRSLATRLCTNGEISLNGIAVRKAGHPIRVGDVIVVPQGFLCRAVRVKALGLRRGPSIEAQLLYEEALASAESLEPDPPWNVLLMAD
jgi:ribosome-associated heat shock protein Hsp15